MRLVLLLTLGVGLVWWLEAWRRRRAFQEGPHYVQQIQVLAPTADEALSLPKIKPLRAERDRRALFALLRRVR